MPTFDTNNQYSWKITSLLTVVVYFFSCAIRFIWIFSVGKFPALFWNGYPIPTTNDSFFWGSIIQHALFNWHTSNILLDGNGLFSLQGALPALGVLLTKLSHQPLETVMNYSPIFISSLIVIPIILIGRLYKNIWWGAASALVAATATGYYQRTMAGYFDTDMFVLTIAVCALYFLLAAIEKNNLNYLVAALLTLIISPYFYPNLLPIIAALIFLWLIYSLIRRIRYKFTPLVIISLSILVIIIAFTTIGPLRATIIGQISRYFVRQASTGTLQFTSDINQVAEAVASTFSGFSSLVIGSIISLILAAIGYVLLVIKKPAFITGLPLLILGAMALKVGGRFAMFATPLLALGAVYLIFFCVDWLAKKVPWFNKKWLRAIVISLAIIGLLTPNFLFIKTFLPAPLLTHNQIAAINSLKSTATPNDYVLTWWDYGSAVWFYSGLKSIASPNSQYAQNLFVLSEILTTDSPTETAKLSRWAVEEFKNKPWDYLFTQMSGNRNPAKFFTDARSTSFVPPTKTRDVYLFLPLEMIRLMSTIDRFSNINLATGQQLHPQTYIWSEDYTTANMIAKVPEENMTVDFKNLTLTRGNDAYPVKAFHLIYADDNGNQVIKNISKDKSADLHVIIARDLHLLIVTDDRLFNSSALQMLLFKNYDPALFEPVLLDSDVAIYKLKI
ncbi:MAG: STT3 domain-containing protein [Parcubacteria group bacterium]